MTSYTDYMNIVQLLAPSLVTAAALAVAASVLGVFVLLRREALLALAVPNAAGVGAAAALRYGLPPLPVCFMSTGLALTILAWARHRRLQHVMLPTLYVAGLCLAFLIIANSGQHVEEMQNLLTGMDVAVTFDTACVATPLLLLTAAVAAILWRRWLLLAQMPAVAQLARLHPARWDAMFLTLLTVAVVLGTRSLGAVMVLVMLFLPAGTVLPWSRRIPHAIVGAIICSLVFLVGGFVCSVEMAWPFSQSVGGVGFALFGGSVLTESFRH